MSIYRIPNHQEETTSIYRISVDIWVTANGEEEAISAALGDLTYLAGLDDVAVFAAEILAAEVEGEEE